MNQTKTKKIICSSLAIFVIALVIVPLSIYYSLKSYRPLDIEFTPNNSEIQKEHYELGEIPILTKSLALSFKNIGSGNFVRVKAGDEKALNKFLGLDT